MQRFDPFGFALENFDTIGRWREKDLGGRPVDARATAPDGAELSGFDGLARLSAHHAPSTPSSTNSAASCWATRWAARCNFPTSRSSRKCRPGSPHDDHADSVVEMIVQSRQFRDIRGRDCLRPKNKQPSSHDQPSILPARLSARPRRHHGSAVDGILPRLGRRARQVTPGERSARPPRGAFRGQRLSQQGMVGAGRRQSHGARQGARSAERFPGEDALRPRPLQRGGDQGEHSQLADGQSALRRAAGLRRRDPFRHEHRSIACPALRRFHQSAQPGAWLREIESLGAQELFDALQLAYFVELAHDADAAGNLPGARLRPPFQGRGANRGDKSVLDAVLADAERSPPPDQSARSAQARRIPRLGARRGTAHRKRRQKGRTPRLASDAGKAEYPAPAGRHPAGYRRAHAPDVRHPGPRFPDRHHAHHDAEAQQRSLARCASRISAWIT